MNVSFLDAMPIPCVLIGADERVAHLNEAATTLLGSGLAGRHYVTALRQPALLDAIEAALRLGRSVEAVYFSSEAGRELTWQVTAAPVESENRQEVLITFLDTTPVREATEMRRDFVANVSHEMRTPLTALLGFIETLKGAARDDGAAREKFLTIMEKEAERMNRLVRDLLSLSRVESEERMRPTDPVALNGLVSSAIQTFAPMAEDNGVRLSAEGISETVEVPGDADQLRQVLNNLIENAIKYGGMGGEVTVALERSADDATVRGPSVTLQVSDSGDGIDPMHIPRLTERFYRVDSHRSRELGGTGLGLAIVKHIVNRHRGRMRIESEPGVGTTMSVVLPMAAEERQG